MLGGWHSLREHRSSMPLSLHLALCISSIFLFLICIFYNKPVILNKMCSWVLRAVLANYQTWGVVGTPDLYPVIQKYKRPRACDWCLKWGPILCDWTLNLGGLCQLQVSLVSELNWIELLAVQLESRELENWLVWEKTHAHLVSEVLWVKTESWVIPYYF